MKNIDELEMELEELKKQFYFLLKSVEELSSQIPLLTSTLKEIDTKLLKN